MALSRREFFEKASTGVAVAGFLAVQRAELDASPLGLPIGSQTWPHREAMKRDLRWAYRSLGVVPGTWFASHLHPAPIRLDHLPNATRAPIRSPSAMR